MKDQLGEFVANKKRWDEHTVINLIPSLNDGDLAIIIDCGVDDFFLEVNRRTHQALLTRNIKTRLYRTSRRTQPCLLEQFHRLSAALLS